MPSEQYRNVEIVSPNLRNQIHSGKDINLALLLMPNNDSLAEYRQVEFNRMGIVRDRAIHPLRRMAPLEKL